MMHFGPGLVLLNATSSGMIINPGADLGGGGGSLSSETPPIIIKVRVYFR